MEVDIPLTDLFRCPDCGFLSLVRADPVAFVKCICRRWWVLGDLRDLIGDPEELKKLMIWDINLFKDQREVNQTFGSLDAIYS